MAGEWTTARLAELCEFRAGSVFKPEYQGQIAGAYPFVKVSDMNLPENSVRIQAANNWVSESDVRALKAKPLPQGTVVFAKIGEALRQNRLRQVVRDTVIDNNMMGAIPRRERVDPSFFYYALAQFDFADIAHGTALPYLTVASLSALELACPPLAEQRAIARILGALDDKIELNRKMNATLEAIARALFKSWFVDFDPVRAKAEGRAPSGMDADTAKLFPSEIVESESRPLPRGWRSSSIGEFVELQRGTTYKSALKDLPGPVLLGLGAIQRNGGFRDDKLSTYGGDSPKKLLVYPGEIFASLKDVTQSADLLGAVARVPRHVARGRLTQDTVKLQLTGSIDIGEVLYRTLLTDEYREYCRQHATGTTNLGLSREDFLSYPIVVAAASVIDAFNTSIRCLSSRAESAVVEARTLARIRDDLLPRLLSGELPVDAAERSVEEVA